MKPFKVVRVPVMGTYCYQLFEINQRALLGFWRNDYHITIQLLFINFTLRGKMGWFNKPMILLFVFFLASCTTKHLPPNTEVVKWKGKNMLITIADSTGDQYQSVYLKHKLF